MKRTALASLALGVGLAAALPGIASAQPVESISGTLNYSCTPTGNAWQIWVALLTEDRMPITSVLTDAEGDYTFVNLSPGNYVVSPSAPQGCGTFPGSRAVDTTNGPESDVDFRITAIQDITGTVTGCPEDEGMATPGVTVNLVDGLDGVVATTETDEDGDYFFQWREAKSGYTVEVVPPAGCSADVPSRAVDLTDDDAEGVDFALTADRPSAFGSLLSFGS